MSTKNELIAQAEQLGIELKGTETKEKLEEMIANKEGDTLNPPATPGTPTDDEEGEEGDELTDEELAARQNDAKATIDAKIKQKKESKGEDGDRMYSRIETQEMIEEAIARFAKQFKKDLDEDDVYDPSAPRTFKVTIPRIKNRFIVGFRNMNSDPYNREAIVFSVDLARVDKNTNKTVVEPWVTVIYRDESNGEDKKKLTAEEYAAKYEEQFPLDHLLKKSTKIDCELVERKKVDTSYDFGLIEEQEVKDYERKGKGVFVKAKVQQFKESFIVKDPMDGQTFEVQPDVVNWSQVKQIHS